MDQPSEQPVGVRECAKQLGVSHSTISRQLTAGLFVNHGTGDRPLLKVSEVREARSRGLDPAKQRGPEAPLYQPAAAQKPIGEDLGPTYATARTRTEEAKANLAELDLAERRGLLLDKSDVVDAFFTFGTQIRERMEAFAADMGARFGATVGAAVADEGRKILTKLGEDFERFAAPATPAETPPADDE